jgi:tetratricopeptide (TPR) repeat protein/CHAT domain-containing protein
MQNTISNDNKMNEREQEILRLAEDHKRPDKFIHKLEKTSDFLSSEKGAFFLQAGGTLYEHFHYALALTTWKRALKCFTKDNNKTAQSKCYGSIGLAFESFGEFSRATRYYKKALVIAKEIGDKISESKCYTNLGIVCDYQGKPRKAIEYHKKALAIDKEIGDKVGESACYTSLGIAYRSLGNFAKAIEYYKKSLKIDKELEDKAGEAVCIGNLGIVFDDLGDHKKAIEYHEKSLRISREIGNKVGESKCYTNLGVAYDCLGDPKRAIGYHEKSLKINREIGNRDGESKCYTNLGISYRDLGDLGRAIENHQKALKINKEIGDKAGQSACYSNLGLAYDTMGNFKRAIENHEKALEIAKDIPDKANESKCYTNLGIAYCSLGDFRRAIEYHEKALKMYREIGDKAGVSACYIDLGVVYRNLGDREKAIENYRKGLKAKRRIAEKAGEIKCLTNLGVAYYGLKKFRKAIEYNERALKIALEIGDRADEAACYGNLGLAFNGLRDFKKAIDYHQKSLKIVREIGDKAGESKCYTNLAAVYLNLGDSKKAIEHCKKSLLINRETGDVDSQRIISLSLGRIYYKSEPKLSYDYCKDAIELSEIIGGRLVEEEHKIGFYSLASDAYQCIVPLCLRLGKPKEAFEYVERSKSRAFLDLLATTEIKPVSQITSKLRSLLDDEETNLARLREIQISHLKRTRIPMEPGEIEKISDDLDYVYSKIEQYDPEYVYTRRGKPLSVNKIQKELSSQGKDVVLVEYYVTRDKTFIFVLSPREKKLRVVPIPLSAEKLNLYIDNYWRETAHHLELRVIGDTWLGLSAYLIEPLARYLTEGDLIYFVPYGLLHYIPMHALELRGEPLIRRHPIAYSPSASLIRFCQSKGSGKLQSCASFGVISEQESSLRIIVEETSKGIAKLFNAKACNGYLATKNRALEKCSNKDIIHFSCHGYFDNADPLSSGVILHNGEILTAREIFGLRLEAELVTLGACQTGLNQTNPGDELIGLTRAFLYAGVPSVIVSLWSVDARSTQELMLEFYRFLKNGMDKATALQLAQKKIMEKKEYSHPYFWAPFILVGDWK